MFYALHCLFLISHKNRKLWHLSENQIGQRSVGHYYLTFSTMIA
jgi:hypothetical protein